jgi:Lrp/AsnC family leucine-responsive transcriptional regulator
MDEIDRKIVHALVDNARISWAELGEHAKLSAPAAAERVRRLEADGVVRGYVARLDPDAVGRGVAAWIAVTLEKPAHRARFVRWVQASDDVQECHHVAGEDDYVLKVRVASTSALESLISDGIKGLDGIARTRTTVVLSTIKEGALMPARKLK